MIDVDDGDVLDELREQLRATPSAAFPQRVRERIARPAAPSARRWPLVIGAAAASILLALAGRAMLVRPTSIGHAAARMTSQTPATPSPVRVVGNRMAAASRADRSAAPAPAHPARRFARQDPPAFGETLVPDDQREAIERLLAGFRLRQRAAPAEAVMSEIDDDGRMTLIPLAIAPLTPIEPLAQTVAADIRGGKR